MENSLKQRIIGAIVLAALAIIFLPAILKEKASNGTFQSKIPEKPQELEEYRVDSNKIEKLKRAKELELSQQIEQNGSGENNRSVKLDQSSTDEAVLRVKQPTTNKTEKSSSRKSKSKVSDKIPAVNHKTVDTPVETVTPNPVATPQSDTLSPEFKSAAWVVQVASFSNESNAINLVEKLKKNQLKAYRRKSKVDNKAVYRVYVGPFIDKTKAQNETVAISKVSETKVVLRVFDPVKH